MTIDLDKIIAIDVHTHAESGRAGEDSLKPEWREAAKRYFGDAPKPTVDDVAAYYRERNMAAVVFTVDAETVTGLPAPPNEEIAAAAAAASRRADPVRVGRPARGQTPSTDARRLIRDHGVRGFKFHPNVQAFFPNDPRGLPAVRGDRRKAGSRRCSTPGTPVSGRACRAAAASASNTRTRCTSTTSPSTSPT